MRTRWRVDEEGEGEGGRGGGKEEKHLFYELKGVY